jgi:hypothetical protein
MAITKSPPPAPTPIYRIPTPEQLRGIAPPPKPPGGLVTNIPGFGPVFGGFGESSPSGVPLFLNLGGQMVTIVPPGGFAGFAQQTPATQALFSRAGRRGGLTTQRRRRRRVKAASSPRRRRKSTKRRGRARLVKGSAAAKRYMAKIRRKRRRR